MVLVGMMGSGKSSVGRRLAARMGRRFVDLDDTIVERAGSPIPEIFETVGEEGFRALEHEAVCTVLEQPEPVVVAAGGGIVVRDENRELLRTRARTVWLRADPRVLAERLGSGDGRPLLAARPAETLVRLAAERAGAYRSVAEHVVDVDEGTVEEVTDRVLALLEPRRGE